MRSAVSDCIAKIAGLTRPRACSTGQSSSENALLQPTRRLHQHLCNRPGLLPGLLGRVPATPYMHYVSAIPGSWQPRKHAAPGTSPFASTPSTVTSAAPHSRGQLQVEARHRGNKASPNEPVFSYQQLFSQDMTSSSAKQQQQQQRQQSQAQQQPSRGFGRSKSRKAGGASGGAGAEPADGAAGPAGTAVVHFCITRQVEYGQNMRMTGAGEQMGAWDSSKGPKLKWSEGHKWTADVPMPPGAYEFKFLIEHRSGHLEWEGGSNRSFTVPKTAAQMQVAGRWNSTEVSHEPAASLTHTHTCCHNTHTCSQQGVHGQWQANAMCNSHPVVLVRERSSTARLVYPMDHVNVRFVGCHIMLTTSVICDGQL